MGQRKGSTDRFTAVRGLITVANPGAFPEDALVDADNVEITRDGTIIRRRGFAREVAGTTVRVVDNDTRAKGNFTTALWKDAGGGSGLHLRVLQFGTLLTIKEDVTPLSTAPTVHTFDVSTYQIGNQEIGRFVYTYGAGYLLICATGLEPLVISSTGTPGNLSIELEPLDLQVRVSDFLGARVTGERYGSVLDVEKEFNLRNTGWPWNADCAPDRTGSVDAVINTVPYEYFKTVNDYYPSPSVLYQAMKLSSSEEIGPINTFSPWEIGKIAFGNTLPPVGHYISSAFSFNAQELMAEDGQSLTAGNIAWSTVNRPTCCAFSNGHAFYAGIDRNNTSTIWVSQLVQDKGSLSRCYQEADPTSPEINDLLPTDGTVLRPVGMGVPIAMKEVGRSIIVWCTNGIWEINGGDSIGFSATSYTINKISEAECTSPQAIVNVESTAVFWAEDGIYIIQPNQYGRNEARNLTRDTIKPTYLGFGKQAKRLAQGVYVPDEDRIYWTVPFTGDSTGAFKADSRLVLVLSLEIQGFYIYTVPTDASGLFPRLLYPFEQAGSTVLEYEENVLENDNVTIVYENDGITPVTETVSRRVYGTAGIAFMASRIDGQDFITEVVAPINETPYDWSHVESPGVDQPAYAEFAHMYATSKVAGLQAPYIHSFFLKDRPVYESINDLVYTPYPGLQERLCVGSTNEYFIATTPEPTIKVAEGQEFFGAEYNIIDTAMSANGDHVYVLSMLSPSTVSWNTTAWTGEQIPDITNVTTLLRIDHYQLTTPYDSSTMVFVDHIEHEVEVDPTDRDGYLNNATTLDTTVTCQVVSAASLAGPAPMVIAPNGKYLYIKWRFTRGSLTSSALDESGLAISKYEMPTAYSLTDVVPVNPVCYVRTLDALSQEDWLDGTLVPEEEYSAPPNHEMTFIFNPSGTEISYLMYSNIGKVTELGTIYFIKGPVVSVAAPVGESYELLPYNKQVQLDEVHWAGWSNYYAQTGGRISYNNLITGVLGNTGRISPSNTLGIDIWPALGNPYLPELDYDSEVDFGWPVLYGAHFVNDADNDKYLFGVTGPLEGLDIGSIRDLYSKRELRAADFQRYLLNSEMEAVANFDELAYMSKPLVQYAFLPDLNVPGITDNIDAPSYIGQGAQRVYVDVANFTAVIATPCQYTEGEVTGNVVLFQNTGVCNLN